MKTIQYYGPFAVGETRTINLNTTYRILQIGIERPLSVPITVYQNYYNFVNSPVGTLSALVDIDGTEYVINEHDVLEFNGLYQRVMKITFLTPVDKYTIIDLAFKDVDE